jgi:CheY-specific phosphatase CheX
VKLEYVETFLDATVRTLERVLQTGLERGEVQLVEGVPDADGITIVIPLGGEVSGDVSLHVSDDTARRLFEHVTGEKHDTLPPLGLDYLKELGNMIAGAAASALNDQGYGVTVAPPVAGAAARRAARPGLEACRIPIASGFGELTVNVALTPG